MILARVSTLALPSLALCSALTGGAVACSSLATETTGPGGAGGAGGGNGTAAGMAS